MIHRLLLVASLLVVSLSAQSAGKTTVTLGATDPDPLVGLPALPIGWDDIHFKLPNEPDLNKPATKVKGANGADLGWDAPVESPTDSGEFTMKKGGTGIAVPGGQGAGLQLQSTEPGPTPPARGWTTIVYSRTLGGKTIYTSVGMPGSGTATVHTGNSFPVGLSAIFELTNTASQAIASVTVTLDTSQNLTEIGSDAPGLGVPSDGTYTFITAVEPGQTIRLHWTYDAFSSTPVDDTEVTITAIFTGGFMGLMSGPGTTRLSRLESPQATLPPLELREISLGGFGGQIRLSSGGAFHFVGPTGEIRPTGGSLVAGEPFLHANGDLCIPLSGVATTKSSWTLSGVKIATGATPTGPVLLYLDTGTARVGTVVGVKR